MWAGKGAFETVCTGVRKKAEVSVAPDTCLTQEHWSSSWTLRFQPAGCMRTSAAEAELHSAEIIRLEMPAALPTGCPAPAATTWAVERSYCTVKMTLLTLFLAVFSLNFFVIKHVFSLDLICCVFRSGVLLFTKCLSYPINTKYMRAVWKKITEEYLDVWKGHVTLLLHRKGVRCSPQIKKQKINY